MKKNIIFNGGIPLAPDIKKLDEAFGVPNEGARISWEDMEQALGMKRRTNRFGSVYSAWKRKLFREHNVVIVAIGNNQGIKALAPNERISYAVELSEQGGRKIRNAILVSEMTDSKRLSAEAAKAQLSLVGLRSVTLEIYRFVQPKQLGNASDALARG